MPASYEFLMAQCDELDASLPTFAPEYECEGERMEAFAGIADEILHQAALSDDPHDHCIAHVAVLERIDAMLIKAGWVDPKG